MNQYYQLNDAAQELGIDRQWLRILVRRGHAPRRTFLGRYLLRKEDFEHLKELATNEREERKLPEPRFADIEPVQIGYTIGEVEAMTGKRYSLIKGLAEDGKIPAQLIARSWCIFPEALPIIKSTPNPSSNRGRLRDKIKYVTRGGNYSRIPPLNEKQQAVVRLSHEGKSFTDIGAELEMSRENASRVYAMAVRRTVGLMQRGIVEVGDVAKQLECSGTMASQLIEKAQPYVD